MCGGAPLQQPPPALDGPAAAQQLLALHAAHLVVVIPGQLRPGPDPPAEEGQGVGGGGGDEVGGVTD